MPKKQLNIVIILAIIVVGIFIALGFMGFGGFAPQAPGADTSASGAQVLLSEVQAVGSVSDLRVEEIIPGEGEPVAIGDTLTVEYTGVLPNGTVFDSTAAHGGQPFTFTIGEGYVIQGWELGLIGMKVGGSRLLAIPPSLGYGASGAGAIPPNSTLIFQVNLLERVPAGSVTPEAAPAE